MKLIEDFDSFGALDKARRHWLTFGKTRKNQIVSLGHPARLTLGERLLGKYARFYQVHTGWTRDSTQFDAISSVGEMKFHVTLDVTYRIDQGKMEDAILDGIDIEETLMRPLAKAVGKQAKRFGPEEYKMFEDECEAQLKVEASSIARVSLFEVNTVDVIVKRDENVADPDEINMIVNTVRARLVKATHDGDEAKAASLNATLGVIRGLQKDKHGETLDVAERAKDVQRAINELMDLDLPSDHPTIQSLRGQQINLVKQAESNYSGNLETIEEEKQAKLSDKSDPPADMD